MNIPNDTGHPWRLHKFIQYQHNVPPIHPVTCVEFANRRNMFLNERVFLSWLVSITYCEITAIFLYTMLRDWKTIDREELEAFWVENKSTLIFGSARKHAKNMDWFVPLVMDFLEETRRQPLKWIETKVRNDPEMTYVGILTAVRSIKFVGRFAADLFMEMLVAFKVVPLQEPELLDWKHCSNLTSGLLNIMYLDDEADEFDKTGKVSPERVELLNKRIRQVQKAIKKEYPEQDVSLPLIIGKICSFRNLFKSSRYGGFHHDRQLENLLLYRIRYRDSHKLWDVLFDIRATLFDESLLGELGNWRGVRKDRKKLWVEKGLTGVESIGEHTGL